MRVIDNVHIGTTVKYAVRAKGTPSVTMDGCDFDMYAWTSSSNDPKQDIPSKGVIHKSKINCIRVDAGQYAMEIPTGLVGKGYLMVRVELQVPDSDCANGYRPEVQHLFTDIKIV